MLTICLNVCRLVEKKIAEGFNFWVGSRSGEIGGWLLWTFYVGLSGQFSPTGEALDFFSFLCDKTVRSSRKRIGLVLSVLWKLVGCWQDKQWVVGWQKIRGPLKRQGCLVRLVVVVSFEALSKCCIAGSIGRQFFVVVVIGYVVHIWLVQKGT